MAERKPYLLRLPPDLWEELNRWAGAELRSLNAQIEYLLRDAVQRQKWIQREKKSLEGSADES